MKEKVYKIPMINLRIVELYRWPQLILDESERRR